MRLIEVVPYDPRWRVLFERTAHELVEVFGEEVLAIHHVGSTAIPNISAKPIVDVLVEVRCIETVDNFNAEMIARGYLPKGEFGIRGRRFFIKGNEEQRSHHIHIFQMGNPEFERHIAFRDYMIAHPEEAEAYSRLKEELARRFPHDIEGYMVGKDAFIKEIERKALVWKKGR